MSAKTSNRPPALPLPSAGAWTKILADAIEVGLSNDERNDPEIDAALSFVRESRTAQRLLSGETSSGRSWDEAIDHLEALFLRPAWMPLHGNPKSSLGPVLQQAFVRWEHFAAKTTICPNLDGALSKAGLRVMIGLVGVMMGCASRPTDQVAVHFEPWRAKEGIGLVLNSLRQGIRPPLTRAALCEKMGLTTGTWDRLRRGVVPSKANFDFLLFASLVAGTKAERQALEFSMRRAFAGARLVRSMETSIKVGAGKKAFWADCWREFERAYSVAVTQSGRFHTKADKGERLHDVFRAVSNGSQGHWVHVWRAALGDDRHYFDMICATLLALSAWNKEKCAEEKIKVTDDVVLQMLNFAKQAPQLQTFLRACEMSGTPEAQRLLNTLPATTHRQGLLAGEYLKQGDFNAARQAYEKSFSAAPEQWLARYQLAWFEVSHGVAERALALLADTKLSLHHEYFAVLGSAHFKLGHYSQALTAFEVSIRRKDSLLVAYELAAKCCRALGDTVKARSYAKNWQRLRKQ